MFTHTDLIKCVLRFYKNAVENVPISNSFILDSDPNNNHNHINTKIEEEYESL